MLSSFISCDSDVLSVDVESSGEVSPSILSSGSNCTVTDPRSVKSSAPELLPPSESSESGGGDLRKSSISSGVLNALIFHVLPLVNFSEDTRFIDGLALVFALRPGEDRPESVTDCRLKFSKESSLLEEFQAKNEVSMYSMPIIRMFNALFTFSVSGRKLFVFRLGDVH